MSICATLSAVTRSSVLASERAEDSVLAPRIRMKATRQRRSRLAMVLCGDVASIPGNSVAIQEVCHRLLILSVSLEAISEHGRHLARGRLRLRQITALGEDLLFVGVRSGFVHVAIIQVSGWWGRCPQTVTRASTVFLALP